MTDSKSLLESRVLGVALTDADGSLLGANRRLYEILGQDAPALREIFAAWKAGPQGGPRDLELRRSDGKSVPVRVEILPAAPESKDSFLLVFELGELGGAAERGDFAAREFAAREAALRAEVQQAQRMRDELVSALAHDLRSNLQAILGWASLARSGKLGAAEANSALDLIEKNARLQARMVGEISDLSRALRGSLKLKQERFEVRPVILAVQDAVREQAAAKGIQLVLTAPAFLPALTADSDRFQQVLTLVLENAVQSSPREGRVEMRVQEADAHLHVTVVDSGPALSPEDLAGLLEPGEREPSSDHRRKGSLLRLALARRLVELMGGTLRAESAGEGQGTAYTVSMGVGAVRTVPAPPPPPAPAQPETKEEGVPSAAGKAPDEQKTLEGLRILVVDDEKDARELLTVALESYGATVSAVGSTADALKALSTDEQLPDIIVCDIVMPEESGYDLIHKLRTLKPERGGRIPAVALTGYASGVDRMRALAAGYQAHVVKPVDPGELSSIIAGLANRPVKA